MPFTLVDVSTSVPWRPAAYDAVLALGVLVLGEAQIHSPDPHRIIADKSFSAVVWGLTAAMLAWRRRVPWVTFVVVTVGLTIEALPAPDSGTLAGFVALCVVLYTVARVERGLEKTVAASAVAVVVLLFHYARDPMASNAVESIQATYAILGAMPVVGRLVSSRQARAAALEHEVTDRADREAEAARAATVAERARIARELHDVIAHSVSVAIVQSMVAQNALADGEVADAVRRVGAIEDTARQTLADMRRLVAVDDASGPQGQLGPQPGMEDLPALVGQLVDTGADVALECDPRPTRLSPGADLAVFRIAQEALTNAINHAPGAAIRVRVAFTEASVEVEVVNGEPTGSDTGPGSGRGLIGMRERVQLYNGLLESGPRPDGGFRVRATLPLEATSV